MSTAAPFDGAPDETTADEIRAGYAEDGSAEDPTRYAPGIGRVPVPPPLTIQPRVYASPPPPPHRGELRVLIFALIVSGLLLLCFCLAGYVVFLNGGFGAGE